MMMLIGVLLLAGFWLLMRPTFILSAASAALEAALVPGADPQQLAATVAKLEQATALSPGSPLAYQRLAQGYLALERPQDALAALEQAYRLDPASPLVQRDLVVVHIALGTRDPALWQALGIDAVRLIGLGDQHLQQGSAEALRWYQTAANLDANHDLAARLTMAAALAGDPNIMQQEPGLVHQLEHGKLLISGGELRWPLGGEPLGLNYGTVTRIGWNSQVVALVQISQPGSYNLSAQVRHVAPAPIAMALGINGQQLRPISLERGDESAETVAVITRLEPGVHLLGVWFLNDAIIDGVDRNAQVDWVAIEHVP